MRYFQNESLLLYDLLLLRLGCSSDWKRFIESYSTHSILFRGKDFFGYSKKDLFGRSSYVMVHRTDLQHLRCKHTESKRL